MGICTLAMSCGIFYLYRNFSRINGNGNEYASLLMGIFIILFSAPQLIWALRPYFQLTGEFVEPIKSNFYGEILKVAQAEPFLTIVLASIFFVVGLIIIINLDSNQNRSTNEIKIIKPLNLNEPIIQNTNSNENITKVQEQRTHQYQRSSPIYPSYRYPYYPYNYYDYYYSPYSGYGRR